MMVRSNNELQSETGYIDARPHHPDRQIFLHRTAGPYWSKAEELKVSIILPV
jgi:hypothetical protein